MNRKQFFLLLGGMCVSAFLGSAFAGRAFGPQPAAAQVPPPVVENQQVVPNAGLRFIDEQGHVLAIIGRQGTGGALTLLNAEGQPSVVIQGGNGGRISVSAMEGGGELRMFGSDGGGGSMVLSSTARGRMISVMGANGAKLFDLNCAQKDSTLMLAEAGGRKGIDLRAGQLGGEFTMLSALQSPVATLRSTDDGGVMTLSAPKVDGLFSALATGSVNYREKGKKVWQFPPTDGSW